MAMWALGWTILRHRRLTLNVNGAIQQTGVSTGSTGGTAGQWAELGSCTLNGQYQMCQASVDVLTDTGSASGIPNYNEPVQATLSMYVRENTYPTTPTVYLALDGIDEQIPASDLKAVVTSNSGPVVVQVWGKLTGTYESWQYTPVLNGSTQWMWTPNTALQTTDPATGAITSIQAVYGDAYANTLFVQPASDSTTALQVQNAAGTSTVFNVGTTNGGKVTINNNSSGSASISSVQEWDNNNGSGLSTLSVSPHTVGNLMLLAVYLNSSGNSITGITGGGVSSWHLVQSLSSPGDYIYEGTVTSTGSSSVTVSYSGSQTVWTEIAAQEFTAGLGINTRLLLQPLLEPIPRPS